MEEEKGSRRKPTFYPDLFFTEVMVILFLLGLVVTLTVLLPVGYEEEANPLMTPSTISPEWYFLWLFQIMKIVPPMVGVAIPFLALAGLILLPFIDTKEIKSFRDHRWFILGGTLVLCAIFVLSCWALLGK